MKRWLLMGMLLGMVACCAAALAQQPDPDDDRAVPGESESAVVQGVTDAAAQDAAGNEQADAAKTVADESGLETETAAAGEAAGEAGGEPDGEFMPTEEIPEDYPVPLPSDI